MMKIGQNQVLFKGVTAYWNYLTESKEGKYSTQILISDEDADAILDAGFNKKPSSVAEKNKTIERNNKKNDTDYPLFDVSAGSYILNLETNASYKSGEKVILPVGYEGKQFTKPIGPGSVLDIICNRGMTSKGEGMYLHKIKVVDLVEVSGGAVKDEFDIGEIDMDGAEEFKADFEDDDNPFA